MIVPQRDASGPVVRRSARFQKITVSSTQAAAGYPPDASAIMPTWLNERRAAEVHQTGFSVLRPMCLRHPFFHYRQRPLPDRLWLPGPEMCRSHGKGAGLFEAGGDAGGREAGGAGGGGLSKPGGRSDSGPCWPSAGDPANISEVAPTAINAALDFPLTFMLS